MTPPRESCPPDPDIVAFAANGLDEPAMSEIREHVLTCATCRAACKEAEAAIAVLRAADVATPAVDLLPAVMERLSSRQKAPLNLLRPRPTRQVLRAAAAVAVAGIGIGLLLHSHQTTTPIGPMTQEGRARSPLRAADGEGPPSLPQRTETYPIRRSHVADSHGKGVALTSTSDQPPQAARDGIAWLVSHQEDSGGWNAEALGGRAEYDTALNGLALLAMVRQRPESADHGAVLRAARHLAEAQTGEGRLGPECDGTMYNHGIATVALMEAYRLTGERELVPVLQAAVDFIGRQQFPEGGWGYDRSAESRPNTSISAWQMQALLHAVALEWHDYEPVLRKGLAWLGGVMNESGHFGYQQAGARETNSALTPMGAYCTFAARKLGIPLDARAARNAAAALADTLDSDADPDYYRAYFEACALRAIGNGRQFSAELSALDKALKDRQVHAGRESGSWQPNDRWGSVGGRLYSTAMALMALSPSLL